MSTARPQVREDNGGYAAFAPGRVNLIGEHTDYNAGLALPFAISAGITVTVVPAPGDAINAVAEDLAETDVFPLHGIDNATGWRSFVRGIVATLIDDGVRVPAANLRIGGTLPRGQGVSSSAALEVALALALCAAAGLTSPDRMRLARLCSGVEHDWVGAQSGLLDQLAVLFGEEQTALRIDFRTLDIERVPLDLGDWSLWLLGSGEARSLAGSGYNQRRAECEMAARQLGVTSLRDATREDAERLPQPLRGRVLHVIGEDERVDEMCAALRLREVARVGVLLNESHASLRDLYDASTPAVEATVAALLDAGAAGARMMGGGFGGQVLALFPPDATPPRGAWRVVPGNGAHLLNL